MTKKIAISGVFISMAMALAFFESMIPMNFGIPGIRLGLANIAALTALFVIGPLPALAIQTGRIILSSFMFGNMTGLIYSLVGGLLSVLVMILLFRIKKPLFSIISISVAGAVFHNIGQITAASIIVREIRIAYYLPVLMLSGVAAGLFVGFAGKYLIKGLIKTKLTHIDDPLTLDRL